MRRQTQHGMTLIELVVFIVIVSVALAGVLTVLNITVMHSGDPMIRKQMLAIAEALLEEVQTKSFTYCDPTDANAATASSPAGCATTSEAMGPEGTETRINATTPFNNVNDYYLVPVLASPITNITGTSTAPAGYSASIEIAAENLNDIVSNSTPATMNALRITVTVSHGGDSLAIEGYRTRYQPNF
ncbi:MAG: prepilin-type N-terminal cleavage/methylation domain-containing protein [Sterolibacterium sp.]